MKKKRILLIALVAVTIAILVTAFNKGNKTTSNKGGSNYTITMNNSAFSPVSLTIAAGATVTWMNDDNVIHAVTTADGSIKTGDIAPTSSYSVTFNTVRTYNYYDAHNTNMTGTLIVASAKDSGSRN
ncbi:MAG TPA: cupredoxin domain-containing protein [Chitinophagaceae bacterium]|nr:cupredoxin domain-containing protein [Chitinophagaceae bacterium]